MSPSFSLPPPGTGGWRAVGVLQDSAFARRFCIPSSMFSQKRDSYLAEKTPGGLSLWLCEMGAGREPSSLDQSCYCFCHPLLYFFTFKNLSSKTEELSWGWLGGGSLRFDFSLFLRGYLPGMVGKACTWEPKCWDWVPGPACRSV